MLLTMSHGDIAHHTRYTLTHIGYIGNPGIPSSINTLPAEILVQIFYQVCSSHPCPAGTEYRLRTISSRTFLKDPVTLSHVCSYWRQITVSLPSLWSHIDLFPDQYRDPLLAARLETYAERSSQALLDIHIMQKAPILQDPFGAFHTDDDIIRFLSAAAPRMKRLTLTGACGPSRGKFCQSVLATCFANFTPGILEEVSINADVSFVPSGAHSSDTSSMGLPRETVEAVWSPVTVLRLNHFRPGWSSKAYHGLTELRLTEARWISQSRLVSILELSPKLRILELDVNLKDTPSGDTPNNPVHLDELEILVLNSISEKRLGPLLRLIAPGQKPLSLSILDPYLGSYIPSRTELEHFISRSNVTQLCVRELDGYPQLAEVIGLMPTVRVLAINDFRCGTIEEGDVSSPAFTLDAIYILRAGEYSSLTLRSIEKFVKKHQVQKLTLWGYDFRDSGLGKLDRGIHDSLYTFCPMVDVISEKEPNPVEEWC